MTVIQLPNNKSGLVFMGHKQLSVPFGDGYLCIFGPDQALPGAELGRQRNVRPEHARERRAA